MAILLGILKIIGIIVLAVIGIVLLTLLCLLFLPLSCEMYVANDTEWSFRAKILGFLRFFQIRAEYLSGELLWNVSVFWGHLILFPREAENEKKEDKSERTSPPQDVFPKEKPLQDEAVRESARECERSQQESLTKTVARKRRTSKKQKGTKDRENTVSSRKKFQNVSPLTSEQKRAIKFLWQELIWYLNRIKPTLTEADVLYSLGDPAWTGEFTGMLSLWPSAYGKRVRLCPDFESDSPYFKGYVQLKSRFYAVHLVRVFLRIYFNKDCKKLFDF